MKIESTKHGNAAVVRLSGRLDAESAPAFESACEQHFREGSTHMVVDMSDLQYVSSMGIRSFLVIAKQAKSKKGAVVLCGLKGFAKEVFDLTNLTPQFQVFDTAEAALASV
jgi:anti-sigma B factor antagonist